MTVHDSTSFSLPETDRFGRPEGGWRLALYKVVFESDTRAGRLFDIVLIWTILASVAVVMLDSVSALQARNATLFNALEWGFTALFTVEYLLRLTCVRHPLRYATSVFGIIDLLALLPTYLVYFEPSLNALIDIRILRLLRVFRILKLGEYVAEYGMLLHALYASRRKIAVFLSFVLLVVLVMGTLMYVVEGPANGFTSIPTAVYWAITTMTTVGFGDITPKTDLGRFIASAMMLIGWGTLAVPTGIVSAEFVSQKLPREAPARECGACHSRGHLPSAKYCQDCGAPMG
ncbi:MAG TPA: ion transporter [Usitatibacteraceae bacterium]|nr:ion transporter [Usitatibacteraceae bacterium]